MQTYFNIDFRSFGVLNNLGGLRSAYPRISETRLLTLFLRDARELRVSDGFGSWEWGRGVLGPGEILITFSDIWESDGGSGVALEDQEDYKTSLPEKILY